MRPPPPPPSEVELRCSFRAPTPSPFALRTGCGLLLVTHGSWCLELYDLKDKRFKELTPQLFFENSKSFIIDIQNCMEEYLGPSPDFTERGRKDALQRVPRARPGGGGGGAGRGRRGGGGGGPVQGCIRREGTSHGPRSG